MSSVSIPAMESSPAFDPPKVERAAILIVDDDARNILALEAMLTDLGLEIVSAVAVDDALRQLLLHDFALILLDIQMPGMNGLETARNIAALKRPPAIVFVTAFDEHALRAFELRAVDYLLKPVRLARLREALSRLKPLPLEDAMALSPRRTHFSLLERGRIWRVAVDDVLYLRAELRYVTARTREREYLLDESLVKLEEEFGDAFLRIHRNCLVARAHLEGFQRQADQGEGHWLALLKDWPERLPVSRRQMHVVRDFVKSG